MGKPGGLGGVVIICIALLGVCRLAESTHGNVGYNVTQLQYRGFDTISHYIILLEPARIFLSDARIKTIKAFTIGDHPVRFQLYSQVAELSDKSIKYKLKAQTGPLKGNYNTETVFNTGLDDLVAGYGDVLAFYFDQANPIAYGVTQCDQDNVQQLYWSHPFGVGKQPMILDEYTFLAHSIGDPKCRKYMVEIEAEPLQVPANLEYLGNSPWRQAKLDTDKGLLVIGNPDQIITGCFDMLGWKATFGIGGVKVKFVFLSVLDTDAGTYYLDYKSESFYMTEAKVHEIWYGKNRQKKEFGPSVIGLYFEDMNPVPYDKVDQCANGERSVEIPINQLKSANVMIEMKPRPLDPCRKYGLELLYRTCDIGPQMTTLYGPRECASLSATTDEKNAESFKIGQEGQPRKIKMFECWVITAPTDLYPRVTLLQNNLKAVEECSRFARNMIEMRDGKQSNGALRGLICDGSTVTVDACAGSELYLLVRTNNFGENGGIRFSYKAVTQEEKSCAVVTRKKKVPPTDPTGSASPHIHPSLPLGLILTIVCIFL